MLNRKIQVGIVKDEKNQTTSDPNEIDTSFADKATIVGVVVEGAVKKIGIVVAVFVGLDTIRKVAVALAEKS